MVSVDVKHNVYHTHNLEDWLRRRGRWNDQRQSEEDLEKTGWGDDRNDQQQSQEDPEKISQGNDNGNDQRQSEEDQEKTGWEGDHRNDQL